jgi:hypothetical protein|tara:strand:+ start:295 stop:477 length:183 start_codon:yes stop_codon:yes gene_type:complete
MNRKIHKDELIEFLNKHYSTLDVDEAHHFVNKHFDNKPGVLETVANEIANKENLMENTNE